MIFIKFFSISFEMILCLLPLVQLLFSDDDDTNNDNAHTFEQFEQPSAYDDNEKRLTKCTLLNTLRFYPKQKQSVFRLFFLRSSSLFFLSFSLFVFFAISSNNAKKEICENLWMFYCKTINTSAYTYKSYRKTIKSVEIRTHWYTIIFPCVNGGWKCVWV